MIILNYSLDRVVKKEGLILWNKSNSRNKPRMDFWTIIMPDKTHEKFSDFSRKYSKKQQSIKFNFRKFVTSNLNIKRSDVFTHNIHSYPGRLFPYIPIFFLSSEKYCPPKGKVLDPFSGSGTVLLESIVNPYFKRDVYGVEINPLGRLISKVKTTPIEPTELERKVEELLKTIKEAKQGRDIALSIPDFQNIDLWFSKSAKKGLGLIKACIEQLKDDDCKDFFWVCFSKLIRSVSRADPNIPPPVLLKVEKYKQSYRYEKLKELQKRNEKPNVEDIFKGIVNENAERVKRLWEIDELREGSVTSKIIWDDSRKVKKGKYTVKGVLDKRYTQKLNESISLIITSPPYLSAQKYVRSTKLELYWLGLTTQNELEDLRKCTIGTENISLKNDRQEIGVSTIDGLLEKIEKSSKERMLIAYEYFKNMAEVFTQCHKLLENKGLMVLVVGNNKIGKLNINTAQLLIDLARKNKFNVVFVLRDEIKGRGMITKRHGSGGLIKDEFVIVLQKIK
jgi:DNA modification methylase